MTPKYTSAEVDRIVRQNIEIYKGNILVGLLAAAVSGAIVGWLLRSALTWLGVMA